MAAFAPLKVGGWAYGEILTSAQMNQLNTDFPFALNLRDGASYTPTGAVSIQTPTTKTIVLNGCTLLSVADGGGVVQCASSLSVDDQIACEDINVGQDALVAGDMTVLTDVALGSGEATTVTVDALTTTFLRVRAPKGIVHGNESPGTHLYKFEEHDIVYVHPAGAPSAACIWQIDPATSIIDHSFTNICTEVMSFRHLGGGNAVVVKDPSGATLGTIGPAGSGNLLQIDVARAPELASAYVVIGKYFQP